MYNKQGSLEIVVVGTNILYNKTRRTRHGKQNRNMFYDPNNIRNT